MANLFPEQNIEVEWLETSIKDEVQFGRSWRFDFEKGDFVMTPTGKVVEAIGTDAWLQWCTKAIATERYRYLIYSRSYGQEYENLMVRHLTKATNESEIVRITMETLMVDPRTASVDSFIFRWDDNRCFFECRVTNVRGDFGIIPGSVVST